MRNTQAHICGSTTGRMTSGPWRISSHLIAFTGMPGPAHGEVAGGEVASGGRGIDDDAVHRDAADKGQAHLAEESRGDRAARPAVGIAERDGRSPHRPVGMKGVAVADAGPRRQIAGLQYL